MDLRWLSAPERDVASAMAARRRHGRPEWVPTKRQVLVHVNYSLLLWYLGIAFVSIGVSVDSYHDGTPTFGDITAIIICTLVFVVWLYGTYWLHRWAALPPSPRSRMIEWRQTLTALANGFEPRASAVTTFPSVIRREGRPAIEHPRFVAPNVEFGNIAFRDPGPAAWRYLAVTLPAPRPHLILDATQNDRALSDLPASIDHGQRLSLEGDFDRWFQAYAPAGYERDALYILTPDVMAALIDNAHSFNVEFVNHTVVFFTTPVGDFSRPETWVTHLTLLDTVIPKIVSRAWLYRDARGPAEHSPERRADRQHPDAAWLRPQRHIGPDGRTLALRRSDEGWRWALRRVGWIATLALLYAVPGIFAFAGIMSALDGW